MFLSKQNSVAKATLRDGIWDAEPACRLIFRRKGGYGPPRNSSAKLGVQKSVTCAYNSIREGDCQRSGKMGTSCQRQRLYK